MKNNLPKIAEIYETLNISLDKMVFCGDDILDLPIMLASGLGVALVDAHNLVKHKADIVLYVRGGDGMAREVSDMILSSRGLTLDQIYQPFLDKISLNDIGQMEQ